MHFPEFSPGKKKILFFSRGRGRGHAIPDIEIVKELQKLRNDVEVRFVSYGTGARTFKSFDAPLIDVGLPDEGSMTAMTVLSGKLIGGLNPDLVVSHEEFAALPAARIFDKPVACITDFFVEPELDSMQSLQCADRIIFTGNAGLFEEPEWVKGNVEYVGPVLRRFEYTRRDRARAREELGLQAAETVVSVLPGSWTESVAPILGLVVAAFDLLESPAKRLIWIAGQDYDEIHSALGKRDDVRLLQQDWRIDRLMVACDAAITKANRQTALELDAVGIPSVALSPSINRIDDKVVKSLKSVCFLRIAETDTQGLHEGLKAVLQSNTRASGAAASGAAPRPTGSEGAALCLSRLLDNS